MGLVSIAGFVIALSFVVIALSFMVPVSGPKAMERPTGQPLQGKAKHPNPNLDGSPFFAGYDGSEIAAPSHRQPRRAVDTTLRSKIIGKWTSCAAPEQKRTATTVTFLESGEYHASRLLTVNGIPIVDTQCGEKVLFQNQMSGTWDLVSDEVHIRVTQATVQDTLGPFVLTVEDAGENRSLFDRGGKEIALFRIN
jgi:hypothetical protein